MRFHLLLLVFPVIVCQAQKNKGYSQHVLTPFSLGVQGGSTQFFGELGRKNLNWAAGITGSYEFPVPVVLEIDLNRGRLSGQKEPYFNSRFENNFYSAELLTRWNLTETFSKNEYNRFLFSVYSGLGLLAFNARAFDLTTGEVVRFTNSPNSSRTRLFHKFGSANPQKTGIQNTREGMLPVGFRMDFILNRTLRLGLDYRFYFVRTDKVDATSGMSLLNPEEETSYSDTPNDKYGILAFSFTKQFTMRRR